MSNETTVNRFSSKDAAEIVRALQRSDKAYISNAASQNPNSIRVMTIDLSLAPINAVKVNFPFKSVYVMDGTDSSAKVSLKPYSDDSSNDYISMRLKDVMGFDEPVSCCFLNWVNQAGKSLTLVFLTDSTFKSGSILNQFSASADGSSINDFPASTFNSANATLLDSSQRNTITIYNAGPDECRVGGAGVSSVAGSEKGLRIPAQQERTYKNTGAVYISTVGTSVIEYQTES